MRFVSDTPPPALVDRLATAYLEGGTAIVPVLDLLFRSAEFWASVGQKTRRPAENIAASVRILGTVPEGDAAHSILALASSATRAGHKPIAWPAPNGYPDVHAAWRSAGSIVDRWNVHRMLIGDWQDGLTRPDPVALAGGATTVGAFVDNLCARVCFQGFQPVHRDALVAFLGRRPRCPGAGRPRRPRPRPRPRLALLRPPVTTSAMTRPPTPDRTRAPQPDAPRPTAPAPADTSPVPKTPVPRAPPSISAASVRPRQTGPCGPQRPG